MSASMPLTQAAKSFLVSASGHRKFAPEEPKMSPAGAGFSRRAFLRSAAGLGMVCCTCGLKRAVAQVAPGSTGRREVVVGGQRVRTIDVHCHCVVRDIIPVVEGTKLEKPARAQFDGWAGFSVGPERIARMDRDGIDVEVLSINAFWYGAERDLAR